MLRPYGLYREHIGAKTQRYELFKVCFFWCCHNTSLPKSWVSPPVFRLNPYASVGLQPSIFE